jgi:tetratricopeptide (TPR) repeat protein
MLAVLEFRQRNCTEAVSHFEAAGALLDSQPDAQNAYGTCLVRLRRFDEATKVFQRTLALDPDNPRHRHLVAAVQLMAYQHQQTIATLQPLIASGRADAHALELISGAYEEAGNTPEAVSALRQAIILDPQNPNLYIDFANLSMNHQYSVGRTWAALQGRSWSRRLLTSTFRKTQRPSELNFNRTPIEDREPNGFPQLCLDIPPQRRQHARARSEVQGQGSAFVVPLHADTHPFTFAVVE